MSCDLPESSNPVLRKRIRSTYKPVVIEITHWMRYEDFIYQPTIKTKTSIRVEYNDGVWKPNLLPDVAKVLQTKLPKDVKNCNFELVVDNTEINKYMMKFLVKVDDPVCAICYENCNYFGMSVTCFHYFCERCIRYLEKTCPMCRSNIVDYVGCKYEKDLSGVEPMLL